MKKLVLLALIGSVGIWSGFAEVNAVLGELSGKVEVKKLNGGWVPAREGMTIQLLDTISTGFNSSALLRMGDSTVHVSPLTRLTLDKLLEQSDRLSTNLYLRVGKVTADVKSSLGIQQNFQVQSPYSTASVRGTRLVYDGITLIVEEGTVLLIPGAPKRDISQYIMQRVRQKLDEDEDGEEDESDEGELSAEDAQQLFQEVLQELAGEFDDETLRGLEEELPEMLEIYDDDGDEGDQGGGDEGEGGIEVRQGGSFNLIDDSIGGGGGGTGGTGSGSGTGESDDGVSGRSPAKGGVIIQWEEQ